MRVTLIHDSNGIISTIIAAEPDGPRAGLAVLPAGEQATHMDFPELSSGSPDKVAAHLMQMRDERLVDLKSGRLELVKKSDFPAKK